MVRKRQRSLHWAFLAWMAWLGLAVAPALSMAMKAEAGWLGAICSTQSPLAGTGSAAAIGDGGSDAPADAFQHDPCGICLLAAGHAAPPPANVPTWLPPTELASCDSKHALTVEPASVWSPCHPRGPPARA